MKQLFPETTQFNCVWQCSKMLQRKILKAEGAFLWLSGLVILSMLSSLKPIKIISLPLERYIPSNYYID